MQQGISVFQHKGPFSILPCPQHYMRFVVEEQGIWKTVTLGCELIIRDRWQQKIGVYLFSELFYLDDFLSFRFQLCLLRLSLVFVKPYFPDIVVFPPQLEAWSCLLSLHRRALHQKANIIPRKIFTSDSDCYWGSVRIAIFYSLKVQENRVILTQLVTIKGHQLVILTLISSK